MVVACIAQTLNETYPCISALSLIAICVNYNLREDVLVDHGFEFRFLERRFRSAREGRSVAVTSQSIAFQFPQSSPSHRAHHAVLNILC